MWVERKCENRAIVVDGALAARHVRAEAFRQDQPSAIPIETAARKDQLRIVVKIFEIAICQFGTFPTDGLPAVEQCDPATYQTNRGTNVRNCCCGFTWHQRFSA